MTGRDAIVMSVLALMVTLWNRWVTKARCRYCGIVRGHHDHCPYQGVE